MMMNVPYKIYIECPRPTECDHVAAQCNVEFQSLALLTCGFLEATAGSAAQHRESSRPAYRQPGERPQLTQVVVEWILFLYHRNAEKNHQSAIINWRMGIRMFCVCGAVL